MILPFKFNHKVFCEPFSIVVFIQTIKRFISSLLVLLNLVI
jgi:hypothetical protein